MKKVVAWAASLLGDAGIPSSVREARLLLGHVLGLSREEMLIHPEQEITSAQWARFADLVDRRRARHPLSHLLGRRAFWDFEVTVTPATLDPRPDSETLIEAVLGRLPSHTAPYRILDLGTGTGCLLFALLRELPAATGIGLDLSEKTIGVAAANADRLGLGARAQMRWGDWRDHEAGCFDIIISNPPYIPDGEIDHLQPEIALYEPRLALSGGEDGLAAYRDIAGCLPAMMAQDALCAMEISDGQASSVGDLLRGAGLSGLILHRDLAGRERCLSGWRKAL